MQTIKSHLQASLVALLGLCALAVATQTLAGGHTGAGQDKRVVLLDPAERSDITGTVLITGANRGIGLELARNYAVRGWRVIATARKPDKADALNAIAAGNPKVTVEQLDVLDHAMVDALAAKYEDQPIDVLLNNAAILGEPNDQNFGSYDYAVMNRVIATNVQGPIKMAEAFADSVAISEHKKIIAMTSVQGSISSLRNGFITFYNTSKAALNMAMRSVSVSVKPRGITVALISPGAVDSEMMNLAMDRAGVSFKLLTPQESAEAVINVIDQYGLDMSGTFMSHTGKEIPW
jgi:NAD(P)-dependent dehydrogenase (short-subunit alcohol dehydrogenase family)